MTIEIATKDDLQELRRQIVNDLRQIVDQSLLPVRDPVEGYKTKDVRSILGCSVNKIVALRIARKIRVKKVGGTLYYNKEDIKNLVQEGF